MGSSVKACACLPRRAMPPQSPAGERGAPGQDGAGGARHGVPQLGSGSAAPPRVPVPSAARGAPRGAEDPKPPAPQRRLLSPQQGSPGPQRRLGQADARAASPKKAAAARQHLRAAAAVGRVSQRAAASAAASKREGSARGALPGSRQQPGSPDRTVSPRGPQNPRPKAAAVARPKAGLQRQAIPIPVERDDGLPGGGGAGNAPPRYPGQDF